VGNRESQMHPCAVAMMGTGTTVPILVVRKSCPTSYPISASIIRLGQPRGQPQTRAEYSAHRPASTKPIYITNNFIRYIYSLIGGTPLFYLPNSSGTPTFIF
jgi:hypothetical protein